MLLNRKMCISGKKIMIKMSNNRSDGLRDLAGKNLKRIAILNRISLESKDSVDMLIYPIRLEHAIVKLDSKICLLSTRIDKTESNTDAYSDILEEIEECIKRKGELEFEKILVEKYCGGVS